MLIQPYVIIKGGIPVDTCNRIIEANFKADTEPTEVAVATEVLDRSFKRVAYICPDTSKMVMKSVRKANKHYDFHLSPAPKGGVEVHALQYEGSEQHRTAWHLDGVAGDIDNTSEDTTTSKLSYVGLLNDPSEYEGGELQFFPHYLNKADLKELKQGDVIVFPSFMAHQVTPVTKGTRNTLISFIKGDLFY
jgi:predicted 2-oxoglutarate/Fe(II)-dependent dioxygenase YbiX